MNCDLIIDAFIGNDVIARTTVDARSNPQTAKVDFVYADKVYQSITLSTHASSSSRTFMINKGTVTVNLTFRAAAGLNSGSVSAGGSVTAQDGKNPQAFNRQIASWG